jgi:hypothetical protein
VQPSDSACTHCYKALAEYKPKTGSTTGHNQLMTMVDVPLLMVIVQHCAM